MEAASPPLPHHKVDLLGELQNIASPSALAALPVLSKGRVPAALTWSDLGFTVQGEKRLLSGARGEVRAGELAAVLGPSGAGKSTLLNALSGRGAGGVVTGSICLNGTEMDARGLQKRAAYVMQEDALFLTQSPREILQFAAALRLGLSAAESEERDTLIDAVLQALRLTECADVPVGSSVQQIAFEGRVSGGQKKRTSIAQELLSRPSLIFLDEPTSGLDSYSALRLVQLLREIAASGCTVICTIHQPSSEVFALFDRTILLADGKQVYEGPRVGLDDFFTAGGVPIPAQSNPADFAMLQLQILPQERLRDMASHAPPPRHALAKANPPPSEQETGGRIFFVQLGYLLQRELRHKKRLPQAVVARWGSVCILNLIGGLIFFKNGNKWGPEPTGGVNEACDDTVTQINAAISNHFGSIFFMCINTIFMNAQAPLLAFIPEKPVFNREYAAGSYSVVAYVLAKCLIDLVEAFISALMGLGVMYSLASLNGHFGMMLLYVWLLALGAGSISFCLGVMAPSPEVAVNFLPMVIAPQILFGGFFTSNDGMESWIGWAQWACTLKYAVNLLLSVEFDDDVVPAARRPFAHALLRRADIETSDGWIGMYLGVLLGIVFGLRTVAVVMLYVRSRNTFQ